MFCVVVCKDRLLVSFFLFLGSRGILGTSGKSSSQPGENRGIEISGAFGIQMWRGLLILGSTKNLFSITGMSTGQVPNFCKPGDRQGNFLAGKSRGINFHSISLLI